MRPSSSWTRTALSGARRPSPGRSGTRSSGTSGGSRSPCPPAISAHAFCSVGRLRHLEYFHDHVRIERMLFDGVPEPEGGFLRPDRSRPGNGLELKVREVERWAS